jgi:predicted alpha/beta-hydrolase family hydrolase
MCTLNSKRKIYIIGVILLVLAIVAACAIYLSDYYRADEGSEATFLQTENISVSTLKNGSIVFEPEGATTGFIFYPGGKVEHHAYEQLMAELARKGILCVLVKMPFNLAVLDMNAADGIQEQYPHIESWYIGGHSLGGSMAASYLKKNTEAYDGLVLLGAYSTADLSDASLGVLSIYGSEDKVMNREKYNECISNLPDDFTEIVIEGGCHAYFGTYGAQDGDGTPTVTVSEQIDVTADAIAELIRRK